MAAPPCIRRAGLAQAAGSGYLLVGKSPSWGAPGTPHAQLLIHVQLFVSKQTNMRLRSERVRFVMCTESRHFKTRGGAACNSRCSGLTGTERGSTPGLVYVWETLLCTQNKRLPIMAGWGA